MYSAEEMLLWVTSEDPPLRETDPQGWGTRPRIFKIDIQLPQRKVYEALLTCNVGRSVTIAETLQFKVEFSAEVLPSDRKLND